METVRVAVNDVSFRQTAKNKYIVKDAALKFIHTRKRLLSPDVTAVNKVYGTSGIDMTFPLADGFSLYDLLKEMEEIEKANLLDAILSPEPPEKECRDNLLYYDGEPSYVCAWAKDGFLLSFCLTTEFEKDHIWMTDGKNEIIIKNIAEVSHIEEVYQTELGVRKYVHNPKHRQNEYMMKGAQPVSPFTLTEMEGQSVLNSAVEIKGRLYGRYRGKYYCFQREQGNCYHGYEGTDLDRDMRRQIDKLLDAQTQGM